MNRGGALFATLVGEAALGYPERLPHPVMAAGALIEQVERRANRGGPGQRRVAGVGLLVLLVGTAGGIGWVLSRPGGIVTIAAGTTALAQRSLHDHVAAVAQPLAAGDIAAARTAVARIVGRDTATLDEHGIAIAAIESLAESFCDGVVMPACWLLVGGLPAAFAAKAINTADSMIGHRTPRYEAFGWASARADDLAAWLPARLSGVLICIAGGGGWRTMWRDARHHASPNGGWPEAAMAGALGRQLGGAVRYDGAPAMRALLGKGPAPDAVDVDRALNIYRRACLLLWGLAGVFAWRR